ncbi:Alpha-cuprenene synthase COP6 [Fusarium oxysporum f. sp. albedinis]|nr:Alpha-cuprenene synthase COP6 [Fusarium oxysporum f. sp. albedinis]
MGCLQLANRSVAETTSAVDWELPKLVAEKFEKPESERQDSTPVDSDSEGVLVELEPQPNMTPSPTASDNSAMRRFLAFDRM